ncbi:nucleoside triphosphate pyrophosphohydrolase [Crocinitomicaceae bacterium CZZ-1]|uniref:Nucleoside triphosphate pyrophosphohydrolase n=1 Tax=Taishania pollutisoli TaxID=2766479 RepID=A0A8J6PIP0_9FLAO|nr:nucleoside triphosphate pyrophosphohydrolase [Taishania pollutisoli]MBC9811730.1 nucleoside triphosphate pyrophosphohydrolase [Taishania pollutisoli]MBX2948335.1 nucleoside triphosphate pyrophosphohydrolase [Crocinitomicaceae bacterium]NGF75433.1 nucleoside triphosphate pyrophosphohydrolase [Fluviicola sp. SGL-29]
MDERLVAFKRLLDIMDDLREKCPWDKKQTFESLRHLTIEETYELADAILDQDLDELEGEIGDLFLHMVFYSKLGSEAGAFDVASVLNRICDKLVHRHPHIYGDTQAETEEEVKANWEKLKLKEGKKSVLEGVPRSLPAMVKASRIQEKVRGVGFDWENAEQVREKVEEELQELQVEVDAASDQVEEEFGDVLFSMINYARFLDVNPENALEKTNKKFIARFQKMEEMAIQNKQSISDLSFEELDHYWNQAKQELRGK